MQVAKVAHVLDDASDGERQQAVRGFGQLLLVVRRGGAVVTHAGGGSMEGFRYHEGAHFVA